jgi:hypothetical protein
VSYQAFHHVTVLVSYKTLQRRFRSYQRELPHLLGYGLWKIASNAISQCTRKDYPSFPTTRNGFRHAYGIHELAPSFHGNDEGDKSIKDCGSEVIAANKIVIFHDGNGIPLL